MLNTPVNASDEVYVDCFTAIVFEATPPPLQVGPRTIKKLHLNPEAKAPLNHKRHLSRQFIEPGDPATKQSLSTVTSRLHRMLAKNRQENLDTLFEGSGLVSDFSVCKLTTGIKKQPLCKSPVYENNGIRLKKDSDKAKGFVVQLFSTLTPLHLTDDTHREAVASFWMFLLNQPIRTL